MEHLAANHQTIFAPQIEKPGATGQAFAQPCFSFVCYAVRPYPLGFVIPVARTGFF
jgi:hypothetical protein